MYTRIKELADSAVALQNKINMEAALREISGICYMQSAKNMFSDMRDAQQAGATTVDVEAAEQLSQGDAVVVTAGKAKKAVKK